ncbi:MAG: hypothetical protein RL557_466 [archaeon]
MRRGKRERDFNRNLIFIVIILVLVVGLFFAWKNYETNSYDYEDGTGELGSLDPFSGDSSNGFIAYWKFDNTFENVYGKTSNGYGNPKFVEGKIGQAVQLDGKDDYVYLTEDSKLFGTLHTISFWIDYTKKGEYGIVLGGTKDPWTANSGVDYGVYLTDKDLCYENRYVQNKKSKGESVVCVKHGGMSGWHYIDIVRDGTSVIFYKDGVKIGSGTLLANNELQFGDIGRDDRGYFLKGSLDELKIWDYTLTDDEIKKEYESVVICSDGKDNDGDGLIDSKDSDCDSGITSCTDSDGGKNYEVKGYVEFPNDPTFGDNGRKYDVCKTFADGEYVTEYVCINGIYEGDENYKCPNSCKDGACIANSSTKTELIKIYNDGNDKMMISFNEHRGYGLKTTFAKSVGGKLELMKDDDKRNISVAEMGVIKYGDYVVVGNEDYGYLLKLSSVKNSSSGFSQDYVRFTDVVNGTVYDTVWDSDGVGRMNVGGRFTYTVYLKGNANNATENYEVRLNYGDSISGNMIVYPTIQTSLGAKIMFYEPLEINLANWDGMGNKISNLMIPDGDGYSSISFQKIDDNGNWKINGFSFDTKGSSSQINMHIEELDFMLYSIGIKDKIKINLHTVNVYVGEPVYDPAVIVIEEKDKNTKYNTLIVTLEEGSAAEDGIGVNKVNATSSLQSMGSNIYKDFWGSIITYDKSDMDQVKVDITYPDTQSA